MESPQHTLVLSFILFTLKGSKVDDNTYIYMLLSCWNSLLLYGNLQPGDIFFLSIDSESFEHLKQYFLFGIIYKKLEERGIRLQFNVLAPPANLLQGFLWKYIVCLFEPVLQGKAHIYIDADTVCLRPLDRLRKLLYAKEGFILCPEGPLSDGNYSDVAVPKDFLQKFPMLPGCSAGLFAFRLSTAAVQQFYRILQMRLHECNHEPAGYCIEQPYFNYVVWKMIIDNPALHSYSLRINEDILLNSFDIDSAPNACFLNLAGEPGNSAPHVAKWLSISQILLQRALLS